VGTKGYTCGGERPGVLAERQPPDTLSGLSPREEQPRSHGEITEMKTHTKKTTQEIPPSYLEGLHRSFTEYLRVIKGHTLDELEESMLRSNLTITEAEALSEQLMHRRDRKQV